MKTRIDYIVHIAVNGANPNGDPSNGNVPRILDGSNLGMITDVSLKHKMRMVVNAVEENKELNDILILPSSVDDRSISAKLTALKFDIDAIKNKYFDVRTFGAVLIDSDNASKISDVPTETDSEITKGKKGKSEKKKAMSHVTGPVSVSNAFSLAPIDPHEIKITRCIDQNEGNKTTFGNKHIVVNAVYKFTVTVNPRLTANSGMRDQDISILEYAVKNLFLVDASAARPAGSMSVQSVVKVEHNSIDGNINLKRISDMFDASGKYETNLDGITVSTLV